MWLAAYRPIGSMMIAVALVGSTRVTTTVTRYISPSTIISPL